MTLQEIKAAVRAGKVVHWSNSLYTVIVDSVGQWLIACDGGSNTGLTHRDGVTLNGEPHEFYVAN